MRNKSLLRQVAALYEDICSEYTEGNMACRDRAACSRSTGSERSGVRDSAAEELASRAHRPVLRLSAGPRAQEALHLCGVHGRGGCPIPCCKKQLKLHFFNQLRPAPRSTWFSWFNGSDQLSA